MDSAYHSRSWTLEQCLERLGGRGRAVFGAHRRRDRGCTRAVGVIEQPLELALDARRTITSRVQRARDPELRHAICVVELIVAVRHDEHRPAAAQRLSRRADPAVQHDRARAREKELVRRALDDQHVARRRAVGTVLRERAREQHSAYTEPSPLPDTQRRWEPSGVTWTLVV